MEREYIIRRVDRRNIQLAPDAIQPEATYHPIDRVTADSRDEAVRIAQSRHQGIEVDLVRVNPNKQTQYGV